MSKPDAGPDDSHWHLDKRVNIALILALCAQAAAGIWYAGRMDAVIGQHEARILRLEAQRVADDRETGAAREKLAEQLAQIQADLRNLMRLLEVQRR